MQSTRENESLTDVICTAFFAEYLIHRDTYWNAYWQQGLSKFVNRPKERQTICKDFIERIQNAETLDERISIIRDLGVAARNAQSEKIQSDDRSLAAYLWNNFLSLFVKDNSLFAKTCHAVRTRLVADALSKHQSLYQKKLEQLHAQLNKKNEEIQYNLLHKLDATKLKEERNQLYNQLLDMQHPVGILMWLSREKGGQRGIYPIS